LDAVVEIGDMQIGVNPIFVRVSPVAAIVDELMMRRIIRISIADDECRSLQRRQQNRHHATQPYSAIRPILSCRNLNVIFCFYRC